MAKLGFLAKLFLISIDGKGFEKYSKKNKMKNNRRASTIPKEEMITLQEEFIGLDKDGNGEISVQELETLLRTMRIKLSFYLI